MTPSLHFRPRPLHIEVKSQTPINWDLGLEFTESMIPAYTICVESLVLKNYAVKLLGWNMCIPKGPPRQTGLNRFNQYITE